MIASLMQITASPAGPTASCHLDHQKRPNPYEGNRLFYAQWDPNVSEDQVREFLNDNESSDEEITWGRNDEEDEAQRRREEEKNI